MANTERFRPILSRKPCISPLLWVLTTFSSLGRPLVDRLNLVLSTIPESRKQDYEQQPKNACMSHRQVGFFSSFEQAILEAEKYLASKPCDEAEIFIIGGQKIYQQTMDFVDRLYVTQVRAKLEGDAFYPQIDPQVWKLQESSPEYSEQGYRFCFQTYGRREAP